MDCIFMIKKSTLSRDSSHLKYALQVSDHFTLLFNNTKELP